MPILIQNISGSVLDNHKADVDAIRYIDAGFGYEQWFQIGYLEVFLQNFKKVSELTDLNKTSDFGLRVNRNKDFVELNISY